MASVPSAEATAQTKTKSTLSMGKKSNAGNGRPPLSSITPMSCSTHGEPPAVTQTRTQKSPPDAKHAKATER